MITVSESVTLTDLQFSFVDIKGGIYLIGQKDSGGNVTSGSP